MSTETGPPGALNLPVSELSQDRVSSLSDLLR